MYTWLGEIYKKNTFIADDWVIFNALNICTVAELIKKKEEVVNEQIDILILVIAKKIIT